MRFAAGVAPVGLIQKDFERMNAATDFRSSWRMEQLTLVHAVVSHAIGGYGAFGGRAYPNTTVADVGFALRLPPDELAESQRVFIDDTVDFARRVIGGERSDRALNAESEPLMGFTPFRFLSVDSAEILRGLYLGGLRDNAEVRDIASDRFGAEIGSGQVYFVNRAVMHRRGLNMRRLHTEGWGDRLGEFRRIGLISDEPDASRGTISPAFVRHRVGSGASDDSAIVSAGKLWGIGATVGVFLADVIDTLEKGLSDYGDADFHLALEIEERFGDLDLTREDAYLLTYLSAVVPPHDHRAVDSSLRYLLSIQREHNVCAMETHLLYVEGRPRPEIPLGKHNLPSEQFYGYIDERLRESDIKRRPASRQSSFDRS